MKKLFLLQALGCLLGSIAGSLLGLEFWQTVLLFWVPAFVVGYVWFWWFRKVFFFRNPERQIPDGDNLIVSPADGRVMYLLPVIGGEVVSEKNGRRIKISEIAKSELRHSPGWLLGIYMTPFDVHFNRAPIPGRIQVLHYHQTGVNLPMVDLWEYINFTLFRKAVNLLSAPFHLTNERMTMQISNRRMSCFLILIADQFVNKITRFFEDGGEVQRGERIAFIERGSQTDLFIPLEKLSFKVRPGDQVYAGTTVIATV